MSSSSLSLSSSELEPDAEAATGGVFSVSLGGLALGGVSALTIGSAICCGSGVGVFSDGFGDGVSSGAFSSSVDGGSTLSEESSVSSD
jgi:hypothetical protein